MKIKIESLNWNSD